MSGLTGNQLLRAWEAGASQPPLDRWITLLALAHPDRRPDELGALTIGQRNALLTALREQTFGEAMAAYVECAACGTGLELALSTRELRLLHTPHEAEPEVTVTGGDWRLRSRLPTTNDLRAAIAAGDAEAARNVLLDRCVVEAGFGERPTPWSLAPAELVARLVTLMGELDPQATVQLRLACPGCRTEDERDLDIAGFFWTEIASEARRLMRDIAVLARAFAWREADVLAMSAQRRNAYLELVGS